ncbi:MAG: DAK2 domain-containing protein [Traorella sp.]
MERINAKTFKKMIENGAIHLSNHYTDIDALNVFPVPDGDTGTNMSMTFNAGVKDALSCNSDRIDEVAKRLSKGLLMGARGNSGVILSQIFRGLYQNLDGKVDVDGVELAQAFVNGSKVAYKAVMRPVEGTILTVIRESSEYTLAYATGKEAITPLEVIEYLVNEAQESLNRTPELLPVLKEVGVVDSGGAGLLMVLQGFEMALKGEFLERSEAVSVEKVASSVESEEFGYCTEFIIQLSDNGLKTFKEDALKDSLSRIGNSLVVVQDDDIVKVHVHTLTPGDALNMGQRYGEFLKLKIENMSVQHENIVINAESEFKDHPDKEYAIITVAAGEGLTNAFKELRADIVISGGQTMNPSTEDFVDAINKCNARHVFVLPNNSNIILAAQQAESICDAEQVEVIVLPTKSIPQGYAALINFNPEVDAQTNRENMMEAVENVATGQVTFAIKDTTYEGIEIKEGDFMGIKEKEIIVSQKDKLETTKYLLSSLLDENSELVTIFTGEDVNEEESEIIEGYLLENYPDVEVEMIDGGQPVYSFIISVE